MALRNPLSDAKMLDVETDPQDIIERLRLQLADLLKSLSMMRSHFGKQLQEKNQNPNAEYHVLTTFIDKLEQLQKEPCQESISELSSLFESIQVTSMMDGYVGVKLAIFGKFINEYYSQFPKKVCVETTTTVEK